MTGMALTWWLDDYVYVACAFTSLLLAPKIPHSGILVAFFLTGDPYLLVFPRSQDPLRGQPEDYRPLRLENIMGSGNRLLWFFPTDPTFLDTDAEVIMGFRYSSAPQQ